MIRESVRRVFWLIAIGLGLGSSGVARADFKEWTVSVAPSYAVAYVDARTAHGGGLWLDVDFGLSDALSLHATGFLNWHEGDATKTLEAGTLSAFGALIGITYTLDVIRLVPSFDISVGALGIRGDAAFGSQAEAARVLPPVTAFGASAGFALDYLWTRHVALGVAVHYQFFLTDPDRVPMYLLVGPRVQFRF
jgi:hypothetical protein